MYFLSKSGADVLLPTQPTLTNLRLPPSDKRKYMEKI